MQAVLPIETRKIFSISELTSDLKNLIEGAFPEVWLCGEVSNLKRAASGHLYFTLKDAGAQITAVFFKGYNRSLKFDLKDGLEVVVHGKISLYESRGQHQILIDYLEPKGVGSLQLAFEQLKAKLQAEGLFEVVHKKPLPFLPLKVGLITSPKGAVIHDMMNILHRRFPNVDILVHPVRVQGEGAAEEIAQAIGEMGRRMDVDVIIVGRGGGSLEDLWSFNEEVVVRAIFNCPITIVSAVGHETDFTLADLVADVRAPTPSAAAELVMPEKQDLLHTVQDLRQGLQFALKTFLEAKRAEVASLKRHIRHPRAILEGLAQTIDDLQTRLCRAQKQILEMGRLKIEGMARHFEALSPLKPLERGYAYVQKEGFTILSVNEAATGDILSLRLSDGTLKVKVL